MLQRTQLATTGDLGCAEPLPLGLSGPASPAGLPPEDNKTERYSHNLPIRAITNVQLMHGASANAARALKLVMSPSQ